MRVDPEQFKMANINKQEMEKTKLETKYFDIHGAEIKKTKKTIDDICAYQDETGYFVKINKNKDLFRDDVEYKSTSKKIVKETNEDPYSFIKTDRGIFVNYVRFLQEKNNIFLTHAQRALSSDSRAVRSAVVFEENDSFMAQFGMENAAKNIQNNNPAPKS